LCTPVAVATRRIRSPLRSVENEDIKDIEGVIEDIIKDIIEKKLVDHGKDLFDHLFVPGGVDGYGYDGDTLCRHQE
jgi:hypothetical protein